MHGTTIKVESRLNFNEAVFRQSYNNVQGVGPLAHSDL